MSKPLAEKRFCAGLFVVCLVLNLAFASVGWRNLLLEVHASRQVQTALTARQLQSEGWAMEYPLPLFGPPWSVPYEFPFYQYAVARLAAVTGLAIEPAGRAVSLFFFYLSLPALFLLLESLGVPPDRRWLLPALVLLSPVYLYYSRSFMIESTALCAAAWFLLAFSRTLDRPGWIWTAAAATLGAAAGLAKATTFAVFLFAAAMLTGLMLVRLRREGAARRAVWSMLARALVAGLAAGAATWAWVAFTDTVKNANPLARVLTTTALHEFNYGTLAQRLTGGFWRRIADTSLWAVLTPANLAILALFGLILTRGRRAATLGLAACFLAGPLTFANLYFVHDYYFYADGVFLLAALVIAWSQLLDLEAFPLSARRAVIVLSLALQVAAYARTYFQAQWRSEARVPELAQILARATAPPDVILVYGHDWNAELAYYSGRRAVMIIDRLINDIAARDAVLDRIEPGRVTALVVTGPLRGDPFFFRPLMQKLGLYPDPVVISGDTYVYLAKTALEAALPRIRETPLQEFSLPVPSENTDAPVWRMRQPVAALNKPALFTMMAPRPVVIIHPYAPAGHEVEGRRVFGAHAPTDLIFTIPAGAYEVEIEFGVLAEAYSGKNLTDGVEFSIELADSGGSRRPLHHVFLNPQERPADRGIKRAVIALPAGAAGELWCRTLPGPAGNMACDWAYWAKIEIR